MNFFERQERARKRTSLLVVLFLLGTFGVCAAVSYILGVVAFGVDTGGELVYSPIVIFQNVPPDMLLLFFAGTFVLIIAGSLYKIAKLSNSGGRFVAEALGGKLLTKRRANIQEAVLLNIVDEMAIASGIPSPPVYLLKDDNTINAFAAGTTYDDAIIGVTKGSIDTLSRDELQGVIAHEFSHIFNGDMKLNIRSIGVLNGILCISLIGEFIMRSVSKSSSKNKKGGGGIALVGLALYIIGLIGLFFGNLIKAAINRQREYLADASAVQFTRNPLGLSNALKKIGNLGSTIGAANADEFSHLYFSSGVKKLFSFSTHPPLESRIRALEPNWDGTFTATEHIKIREVNRMEKDINTAAKVVTAAAILNEVDNIGTLNPEKLQNAAEKLEQIPKILRDGTGRKIEAQLIIFALLLDKDSAIRKLQKNIIKSEFTDEAEADFEAIEKEILKLEREAYLNLINLSLSTLKSLTKEQYLKFKEVVNHLIEADKSLSWFELNLKHLVLYPLDISFGLQKIPSEIHSNIFAVGLEVSALLSAVACSQFDDEESAQAAFNKMAKTNRGLSYVPLSNISLPLLESAYREAQKCKPLLRRKILELALGLLKSDGKIAPEDLETIHALASLLHLPISI
ncbi:MAG: M48 family metallopeptidase [Campylobacteraceae bacterium]|jgi:Zn-dependent protease with chaperone function|nr:M48 family metallopeptidase [Campylobacteraceae bacterium]